MTMHLDEKMALRQLERIANALEAIGETLRRREAAKSPQMELDLQSEPMADLENDLPWEKPAPVEEKAPSRKEVMSALATVAKVHGVPAGKKLLESFGVTKLDDLPAQKWAALMKAAQDAAQAT